MKDDFKEIVLSSRQDDFYKRHMYSNFGDLGTAVQVVPCQAGLWLGLHQPVVCLLNPCRCQ